MAAMMLPSISHALRKSFTITRWLCRRPSVPPATSGPDLSGVSALLADTNPEKTPPPVLKPRPSVDVPVIVVAGAHIGDRRRQVAVEEGGRKLDHR